MNLALLNLKREKERKRILSEHKRKIKMTLELAKILKGKENVEIRGSRIQIQILFRVKYVNLGHSSAMILIKPIIDLSLN